MDESSANGTFLQQGKSDTRIDVRQHGRLQLEDGDVILILGKLLEGDEAVFWRLTFRDSEETRKVSGYQPATYLEYSLSQQKLFLVNDRKREELFVVIKRDGTFNEQAGVAYANMLLSDEGQKLVEEAGFVPFRRIP